jgi:hypothetical protein
MSQENQQGQVTDLEDSLFTEQSAIDDAFNPVADNVPEAPAPIAEGSAVVDNQINYATPQNNEEVRFQYWQSEADKAKNENERLKQTVEILQDTLKSPNAQTGVQPEVQASEPELESFRNAPEKPARPMNFNRAEAIDDPNSPSAQYMDQMDHYSDEKDTWNSERVEYEADLLRQERESIQDEQRRQQEAYAQQQRQGEELNAISQQIKQQYGANDAQIADFVEKMSSPESLNVNNLWRLYQMDNGQVPAQPASQPSPTFNQIQRAQSVPAPMGVQSAANPAQHAKKAEDIIMDDLISDYRSKNPWGNN